MAPAPLREVPNDRIELAEAVRAGEREVEAGRYAEAARRFESLGVHAAGHADLALRTLLAHSWARLYLGELPYALAIAERARALAERPEFGDAERADAVYHLGCVRLKLSNVSVAISLFTVALELCDRSGLDVDQLRSHILEWRSRGYQVQRDWEAARVDVERALELAQAHDDEHTVAHLLFQTSLIAERTGQTLLAFFEAERAHEIYERLGDRANAGRLLNNLGGLAFLLGRNADAVDYLERAIATAVERDAIADAAQAISSLAQVHLRTGEPVLAAAQAREALELLTGRDDFLEEIGNAQLVLGRALAAHDEVDEAERWFAEADASFARMSSTSHRAAVWTAQGDLARRCGELGQAADHYRDAVALLQDFHF